MEIKYLKLIKTIAEEGNISRSASRLYLTQSALSHQLRDVESQLGFKVFFRSRNNWKLTEEGKALYQMSKSVLTEIEQGLNKIKGIQKGSEGRIRISTECYSFYHGLPMFIQKMAMLYPNIAIKLVVEATHQPISKLLSNELDMTIVTTGSEDPALSSAALFEDEVFALMHEENELSQQPYLMPHDFRSMHLIIHSFPLETVSVYTHFLQTNNITPSQITAIPLTEVALEMVNANMGVICLPKWALDAFTLPESIVFKRLGETGVKRKHKLVFRKADQNKKYLHDFIENIKEEFVKC